ncbi:hypothetical protein BGZ95_011884 [Linnemannia exigua]|uniref:Uncharacterized protein n=1 Tax=Linnemannia exigua TaxID=604196 RepID=A0AAD4DJX3_9FUNG|nr:hypothetical protein BGZ95_011884 [Linnemannia exigua]
MGVLEIFTIQLPKLPPLPFLTTLQIDFAAAWDIMHLFTIFKACPGLEELVVSDVNPFAIDSFSCDIQYSPVTTADEEVAFVNGLHGLPVMTRLYTCSVDNMMISLPALEAILQACPHLSKLILALCSHFQREGQGQAVYSQVPSIVKSVGTHCPHLGAFHISMSQDRDVNIERELARVFETFPHMQEVNIMDRDMRRPSFVNVLRTVANRVTTLNLIPYKRRFEKPKSTWLRDILCSFPHLLHLRARSVIYRFEDMDLNDMRWQDHERHVRIRGIPNRRDYPRIPSDDMSIASQYIWACRGLRTLHVSVIYHGSELAPLTIFGFLSRMCPRLEELHLALGVMPLSLQGGFCLLTRLQHLERLRITTSHYDSTDEALFWMQPISPSITTQDFAAYPHQHRQTLENILKWPQFLTPPDVVVAGSTLVEKGRDMGMDLSKIGHGDDLQEWFDDRYGLSTSALMHKKQPQQHIWPKLQLLWFEYSTHGDGGSATMTPLEETKKAMAKVRPNVDFRLTRYHPSDYTSRTFKY